MSTQRGRLTALQLMKTLGIDGLSIDLTDRMERGYNPWTAPLVAHIVSEGTEAVVAREMIGSDTVSVRRTWITSDSK
jgi:hypothetical protein